MIRFENVSFHYGGETGTGEGVDAIDLEIGDGEVVVLCGESGCGKTTITRLANGLAPHYYEGTMSGRVIIDDICVNETPLSSIAAFVGSIFQNPKSQFFNIETESEMAFGCENLAMEPGEIRRRIQTAVREMQLEPLMRRNIFELSGGEKQQIACGSVYTADPKIYVMDEPSSNLDKKAIHRLHDLMAKIKADGKTMIISEHRLYYLMDIADRFVYIRNGKIVRSIPVEEMRAFTDAELGELGLRCTDLRRIQLSPDLEAYKTVTEKDWTGNKPALEGIDLSCARGNARILDVDRIALPPNSIIAVIGDNGSGKSTLAETLCGVIPSDGSVSYNGVFLSRKDRARKSFMVMQDVNRQLFSESVAAELTLNTDATDEKVSRILNGLGLSELKSRHPASLSGGQKQRVAIASALCAGKDILFYDEPTSGLDRLGMERFGRLLRELRDQINLSIIITHDPELILSCCTHVLHLADGRVQSLYPLNDEGVRRLRFYFLSRNGDSSSRRREKTTPLGKIVGYMGANKRTTVFAGLLMLLGTVASVIPYLLVYRLITALLAGAPPTLSASVPLILAVLGCEILYASTYTYGLQLSHRAAFRTLENIRLYLKDRMEEKPFGQILDIGTGAIKKLFTDDIEAIELILAHMIPEGFANLIVVAVVLLVMTAIDWQLMLLTCLTVGLGISVSGQMFAVGVENMGSYFAATKRLNNTIIEFVNGMEVVRVFNREGESGERYESRVKSYRDFALGWYRVCWPWMALYGGLFSTITLYSLPFGLLLILLGALSAADYILILCLSFGISPLLIRMMSFIGAIPNVNMKLQALEKAMDYPALKTGAAAFESSRHDVEFKDVTFAYKDAEVLKGVSFVAEEGRLTALVGASGSGKSTAAKLLAHYYDVSEGEIFIGGQEIRTLQSDALSAQIAYLSQDIFLFNKTILENIRVGRPDATDDEVMEAARKAQCEEFISELENGYETVVGDAGNKLSGGQKQRIAFARAILKDAPIIILDEATAFVDPENERKIAEAIRTIIRGKTVIVIAHKLRSIMNADQILVLENGRIRASGKHDDLLTSDPVYANLWSLSESASGWVLKEREEKGL